MAYEKPRGLWVALYPSMGLDPHVLAAARALENRRVPKGSAVAITILAWARLHAHALTVGDVGELDGISDAEVGRLAWPESDDARRRVGGFSQVGRALIAALSTPPVGESEGLIRVEHVRADRTADTTADRTADTTPVRPQIGRRIVLLGFEQLHNRVLRDRKNMRDRRDSSDDGRTTAHEELREVSDDRRPGPNPTQPKNEEKTLPLPPPVPPSLPGAASASSTPGAGVGVEGQGSPSADRAAHLLRTAAPNLVGQQRNGRDTTLRDGSYYLMRLGSVDVALRDRLLQGLGQGPAPGVLLAEAAPGRFKTLTQKLGRRLRTVRKPEPYVRSMLAQAWQELLSELEDAAQRRRGVRSGPEGGA